eukprot:CAMPEP_0198125454 /NCGR_PEP_ID=MMETSP1442-20131203/42645_1 /TAXON_ID= /ORGANISM="Craspedostauros australis, Strain CCMP3328" /LENGTH=47 /DNA_ID= /DNA_START= /DNA_END= /DNA_ORIENTATION=
MAETCFGASVGSSAVGMAVSSTAADPPSIGTSVSLFRSPEALSEVCS